MAKKKTSALNQLFHTPISISRFGILTIMATGLVSLNLSLFLKQPEQIATIPVTISQNTLQDVLGTSISIGETLKNSSNAKNDPITKYWEEILSTKPEYRDAYIALSVIAYNKHDCNNTRFYLDKAYDMDPDSEILQELIPHLKTCLENSK